MLLLASLPASVSAAAKRAPHCDAALATVTNGTSDIFVYLHGSDWNPLGEAMKTAVWDQKKLAKAFGADTTLVAVDHTERLERRINDTITNVLERVMRGTAPAIESITTEKGTEFTLQDDGSWLASGANPSTETYTIALRTTSIPTYCIILELLTHDSLRSGGPGRENGNIVITEITPTIATGHTNLPATVVGAWADYAQKNLPTHLAVDGIVNNSQGWAIDGNKHHKSRKFVLLCDPPVPAGMRVELTINCVSKWKQHTPGRLRVVVSDDMTLCAAMQRHATFDLLRRRNRCLDCSADNYPAVLCFDAEKRLYGRLQPLRLTMTVDDVASELQALRKTRIERDQHWTQAENSTGEAKAESLGRGIDAIGGLGHRNKVFKAEFDELVKADPEDRTGYGRRYAFPLRDIQNRVNAVRDEEGHAAALAWVDRELQAPNNKRLLPSQLQDLALIKFHLYKSWKEHEAERFSVLRDIVAIDAETHQGIGAQGYLLYHGQGDVSLAQGWKPNHIRTGPMTWGIRFGVAKSFPHPGFYRITPHTRGGKNALRVFSVSLLADGRVISKDAHEATLRYRKDENNNYYLKLPDDVGMDKLMVRMRCEQVDGSDHQGRFTVRPLLPEDLPEGHPLLGS